MDTRESVIRDMLETLVPNMAVTYAKIPLAELVAVAQAKQDSLGELIPRLDTMSDPVEFIGVVSNLAAMVAIASFLPSGADMFGRHYKNSHPDLPSAPTVR